MRLGKRVVEIVAQDKYSEFWLLSVIWAERKAPGLQSQVCHKITGVLGQVTSLVWDFLFWMWQAQSSMISNVHSSAKIL